MSIRTHTGTAEIIPFPVRFRTPTPAFDAAVSVSDLKTTRIYDAGFASSWYHAAAVEDELRGPKS